LWCEIHTNPVVRCFVNREGLNCEDMLEGVVPELANGLRLSTEMLSQDLNGAWVTVWV
jgi:hypothetical protein